MKIDKNAGWGTELNDDELDGVNGGLREPTPLQSPVQPVQPLPSRPSIPKDPGLSQATPTPTPTPSPNASTLVRKRG